MGVSVLEAVLQSDSDMARAVQEYQRALTTANGAMTKVRRHLWGGLRSGKSRATCNSTSQPLG